MNIKKTVLSTALASVLGFAAIGTQAAVLNVGDRLTLAAGSTDNGIFITGSGSYFAMDTNANSKIASSEKAVLSMGTTGIIIGQTTLPGPSHPGPPTAGDSNAIDAPWAYFGNTGSDYTTVGITGGTTSGLDLSGWTVTWNGTAVVAMSAGAWATGTGSGHTGATGTFADGVANFYWSGIYGDSYSLDYRATVPLNDPSGFGGVHYELHLEGVVNAVPVPAAAWLFGSGLLSLIGIARRKAA